MTKKIKYENELGDTYINIQFKHENINSFKQALINKFMNMLNTLIGAYTEVNYHINRVVSNNIFIPIFIYTNDETKISYEELIKKRVNTIYKFFEKFDTNLLNNKQLWLIRALYISEINITDSLHITTVTNNESIKKVDDHLYFKPPNIKYISVKKIKLIDNSTITVVEDPYIEDYGLYINLSVPFSDMSMGYNCLHLYEHLATKAWSKLNSTDLIELNGSTFQHGICYVYSIHKSIDSLKRYCNKSIEFMIQSRNIELWNNIKEEINMETIRTISETRKERSLVSMGRSDYKAYNFNYDINIFHYWSNRPFNILITTNSKIDFNIDSINKLISKNKLQKVNRPKDITFKHIPIEVLKTKSLNRIYILKEKIDDIKKEFTGESSEVKCFYGVDCSLNIEETDVSENNTIMHPLLYLNNFFTVEELQTYVKKHILPLSSCEYSDVNNKLIKKKDFVKRIEV